MLLICVISLPDTELINRTSSFSKDSTDIDHPLANRADRQPGVPLLSERKTSKESHEERIFRFRDRILPALKNNTPNELYDCFDQRSRQLIGSLPQNSERALFSDLWQFCTFCENHNHKIFPIQGFVLDHYLGNLMAANKAKSTIDRRIASLVKWCKLLELDDPRKHFEVMTRLGKIRQMARDPQEQKSGLRAEHLQLALDSFDPNIPRDVCDIALLFTAFETMCRRSEISKMTWGQFSIDSKDHSGTLFLPYSKTDQDAEGAFQYLSPLTVELLEHWRSICRQNKGAIFRGIYSDGRMSESISDKGIARAFKRIAKRLGFSEHAFAGHSTRIGAAQEMAERNIEAYKIMLSGRWKDMRMVTRYTRQMSTKKSGVADLTKSLGWGTLKGIPK